MPVQNKATVKEIMSGKYLLVQPRTQVYFKPDPTKTRIVPREEMSTGNPNAGKHTKRNGITVILVTSFPQSEDGPFFVKLKGPLVWPSRTEFKQQTEMIAKFTNLNEDGYTDELDSYPIEDLPKLWAKKKSYLNLQLEPDTDTESEAEPHSPSESK